MTIQALFAVSLMGGDVQATVNFDDATMTVTTIDYQNLQPVDYAAKVIHKRTVLDTYVMPASTGSGSLNVSADAVRVVTDHMLPDVDHQSGPWISYELGTTWTLSFGPAT